MVKSIIGIDDEVNLFTKQLKQLNDENFTKIFEILECENTRRVQCRAKKTMPVVSLDDYLKVSKLDAKSVGEPIKVKGVIENIRLGREFEDILLDSLTLYATLPFLIIGYSRNLTLKIGNGTKSYSFTKHNEYLLPWQAGRLLSDGIRFNNLIKKGNETKIIVMCDSVPSYFGKDKVYHRLLGLEVKGRDVYL